MLYRIIKKKSKQNFLDNWTIGIRIFWKFPCREQVICVKNCAIYLKKNNLNKNVDKTESNACGLCSVKMPSTKASFSAGMKVLCENPYMKIEK